MSVPDVDTLTAAQPGVIDGGDAVLCRALRAARAHLGLEIAFVSEFVDGRRVFRQVDADDGARLIEVGASDPLPDSYCQYVVTGQLPEFLADPAQHPVSARLPATSALPVGTHLSVAITFSDGRVYGTLCCFSRQVESHIDARDLNLLRLVAELIGEHLERLDAEQCHRRAGYERIAVTLASPGAIHTVFQPLVDLRSGRTIGVEALSRFPTLREGPESVFAQAWHVGLGVQLELQAIRNALTALPQLPGGWRLSVNAAPATLVSADFRDVVRNVGSDRLTVEVTEHAAVNDYDELKSAARYLSESGIRLAIDDVGMGFSGLHTILESCPNSIKIDRAVVSGVDTSPAKQAMIEALVSFGNRTEVLVIAEGIETAEELRVLRTLGVPVGQGYHLGRPGTLASILVGKQALSPA